jgi:hypothetical protein
MEQAAIVPANLKIGRLARLGPLLAMLAVALAAGIHLFSFISDYAVNLVFYDQWDILNDLFYPNPDPVRLFLQQLGPHREGVGLLVDSLLYPRTSWNTRAESFFIAGCVVFAMLLAVLLKYRLSGKLTYSDIAIPLIFLTLAQYETFIGTPNAAYSGIPLLLILLYCHALLSRGYRIRYLFCLFLNFLLVYTGFGLFMGVVTLGVFALECYRSTRPGSEAPLWAPLAGLAIAGATLGSFFVGYTPDPAAACFVFPDPHPLGYLRFMAMMTARFSGLILPIRIAEVSGFAAIVCGAAILLQTAIQIAKRNSPPLYLICGVLMSFSAIFMTSTAVGRVCLGLRAAYAPRYPTLLIPGIFATCLFLQSLRNPGIRRGLTMILILCVIPGCLTFDDGADWFADGKRAWAQCYLRTEDIAGCTREAQFMMYPDPGKTHLQEKLAWLKAYRLNLYSDSR